MRRQARLARRPISRPGSPPFSRREIFSRAHARDSHSTRFGPRAKSLRRCRNFFPNEVLCLRRKPFVPGDSETRRPVCSHLTRARRSGVRSRSPPQVRRDSWITFTGESVDEIWVLCDVAIEVTAWGPKRRTSSSQPSACCRCFRSAAMSGVHNAGRMARSRRLLRSAGRTKRVPQAAMSLSPDTKTNAKYIYQNKIVSLSIDLTKSCLHLFQLSLLATFLDFL
jgi:hypothetical protein